MTLKFSNPPPKRTYYLIASVVWESSSWAVFSGLESQGLTGSEASPQHGHWHSHWLWAAGLSFPPHTQSCLEHCLNILMPAGWLHPQKVTQEKKQSKSWNGWCYLTFSATHPCLQLYELASVLIGVAEACPTASVKGGKLTGKRDCCSVVTDTGCTGLRKNYWLGLLQPGGVMPDSAEPHN